MEKKGTCSMQNILQSSQQVMNKQEHQRSQMNCGCWGQLVTGGKQAGVF